MAVAVPVVAWELSLLRDAVRYEPESSVAYFDLAFYYEKRGKHREAVRAYSKSLSYDSSRCESHNNYGVSLFWRGQLVPALVALQKAAAIRPESGTVWRNVANVLDSKGDVREAATAYATAAQYLHAQGLLKSEASVRNALGFALERLARSDESVAEFRAAFDSDLDNSIFRDDLKIAEGLRAQKHLEEIKAGTRKALKRDAEIMQELIDKCKRLLEPMCLRSRTSLKLDSFRDEGQMRQLPRVPDAVASECEALDTSLATPSWRPTGEGVWLRGCGGRYLPDASRAPRVAVASIAPRWRALKKRTACDDQDADVVFDGEYVPPRPAYLDAIGDVPRPRPVFYQQRRQGGAPLEALARSASLRQALSTVGLDSQKLLQQLQFPEGHGPKLCWDQQIQSRLRYRLPPQHPPRDPALVEEELQERRAWKVRTGRFDDEL